MAETSQLSSSSVGVNATTDERVAALLRRGGLKPAANLSVHGSRVFVREGLVEVAPNTSTLKGGGYWHGKGKQGWQGLDGKFKPAFLTTPEMLVRLIESGSAPEPMPPAGPKPK
eukprot:1406797-Prymnesium_polylepis.2